MSNVSSSIASSSNNATVNSSNAATPAPIVPIADIKASLSEADAIEQQQQRVTAAYARIVALSTQRQTWNDTAYKTSNDMLYNILQQCYSMYYEMCGKTTEASALREALAKHIGERNIKVFKSTHTLTKIVRCVFDGDYKRFNAYSRTLQAALAHKVPVDGLAQFITENGGIDEIRRPTSSTALSTADKAQFATTALKDNTLATINEPAITQLFDAARDGELHVAIVTQRAGGVIELKAIVSSETVLKTALAAYYNAHKDAVISAKGNAAQANKQADDTASLEELAKHVA